MSGLSFLFFSLLTCRSADVLSEPLLIIGLHTIGTHGGLEFVHSIADSVQAYRASDYVVAGSLRRLF